MLGICKGIDYTIFYFEGLLLVTVLPLAEFLFPLFFDGHTAHQVYHAQVGGFCFLQII